MAETYTSGMWTVKSGEEDAFVVAWRDFVTWATGQPDFRERIMRVSSHCEDFQPSTYELVRTVE